MRETLKSLSIFSAMLLLLLLISSGCDVNIPGCGKRSLPFFKKIASPVPTVSPAASAPATVSGATPSVSPAPVSVAAKPLAKPTMPEAPVEMSISKSKPAVPATNTPTATATPMEREVIAYTSIERDKPTLWTMNTDGTERTRITNLGTGTWFPLWSPNGKVLAFLSDMADGKINLFTLKKGTRDFVQVTSFPDMTFTNPDAVKPPFSWSPRSDEICFIYHNQVWKVDLGSLAVVTLSTLDALHSVSAVEWAPHRDNKFIAYLANKGRNFTGLILVNPRLLDQLKLVEAANLISDLSWTPDARKLAYVQNHVDLYSASPETSLPKLLFKGMGVELGPLVAFSPVESGNSPLLILAKKTNFEKGYRVALLDKASKDDLDSGTLKFLTEPGVVNAIWSPDGSKIAYLQNGELWVMDSTSGGNKTRLAATGILSPSWSKK